MTKKRDRTEYGFQSPQDVNAAKSKLQAIVELSKAERRVAVSASEARAALRATHEAGRQEWEAREAAMIADAAEREDNPPAPVVEVAPLAPAEQAPAIDFQDGTWIEQRTPETTTYRDNMDDETGKVWTVTTGRYLSTWRKRTPADGDVAVVFLPPAIPAPEKPQPMERHKWFSGNNRGGPYASVESNRRRLARDNDRPNLGSFTPGSRL